MSWKCLSDFGIHHRLFQAKKSSGGFKHGGENTLPFLQKLDCAFKVYYLFTIMGVIKLKKVEISRGIERGEMLKSTL